VTGPQPAAAHGSANEAPLTTVEEVIRHRLALALGGWRGAVETALPTVVFVGAWLWRGDVRGAVVAAMIVAIVLAGLRLAQRSSLQHVLGAVFATAIAAWFALRSGRAEDAFLPGILLSVGYGIATVVSIVFRWPLLGFVVGIGDPRTEPDLLGWRKNPPLVRVCQRLTWVLVGLYAVRVGIMGPLYLVGNVAGLGVAKIVLGWPLWVAALAVMGGMLMRGHTPLTATDPSGHSDPAPG